MKISRVQIRNFRNFLKLDVDLSDSVLILGENQVGKSNFLHALRILFDPSLPDSKRYLKETDFFDGIESPIQNMKKISIMAELQDFEDDEGLLAALSRYLVKTDPIVAQINYEFYPGDRWNSQKPALQNYDFEIWGGANRENQIKYSLRKMVPMELLPALRDTEADLDRWAKSPLKPLIEEASEGVNPKELARVAEEVFDATNQVADLPQLKALTDRINKRFLDTAGKLQAYTTNLGFLPTTPEKLLRNLNIHFDDGRRGIDEASLGSSNVLYLVLKSLELELPSSPEKPRLHTFFAIEEPEAHLHPHLQRTVFGSLLRKKNEAQTVSSEASRKNFILTSHSPSIASSTPLNSIVLLKKSINGETVAKSSANIPLTESEADDIERYLDVTRAEALFSKAILFVEGDAEKILIPALAKKAGYNLDALGISVCSISGTNFEPYVKYFGPLSLDFPFAVLTDLDPQKMILNSRKNLGDKRVRNLIQNSILSKRLKEGVVAKKTYSEAFGIFMNSSTLEIELYYAGFIPLMNRVMQDLCPVKVAKKRFSQIAARYEGGIVPKLKEPKRFLSDIEYVGKGRFAQRLAWYIENEPITDITRPEYIVKAINFLVEKVR